MRQSLADSGYDVDVVAINATYADGSQANLTSVCSFDLLQDVPEVGAWNLMGGRKDDMFIYREGGSLASGGYLPISGTLETNLSLPEGYANLLNAIKSAYDSGPGEDCAADEGGLQRPGDANQDGHLDIADGVALLSHLFLGTPEELPCGDGSSTESGNQTLLDANADSLVDASDVVHVLRFLFLGDAPPGAGTECRRISTCPDACEG